MYCRFSLFVGFVRVPFQREREWSETDDAQYIRTITEKTGLTPSSVKKVFDTVNTGSDLLHQLMYPPGEASAHDTALAPGVEFSPKDVSLRRKAADTVMHVSYENVSVFGKFDFRCKEFTESDVKVWRLS